MHRPLLVRGFVSTLSPIHHFNRNIAELFRGVINDLNIHALQICNELLVLAFEQALGNGQIAFLLMQAVLLRQKDVVLGARHRGNRPAVGDGDGFAEGRGNHLRTR